jgi:hypothetical protein
MGLPVLRASSTSSWSTSWSCGQTRTSRRGQPEDRDLSARDRSRRSTDPARADERAAERPLEGGRARTEGRAAGERSEEGHRRRPGRPGRRSGCGWEAGRDGRRRAVEPSQRRAGDQAGFGRAARRLARAMPGLSPPSLGKRIHRRSTFVGQQAGSSTHHCYSVPAALRVTVRTRRRFARLRRHPLHVRLARSLDLGPARVRRRW